MAPLTYLYCCTGKKMHSFQHLPRKIARVKANDGASSSEHERNKHTRGQT